VRAVACGPRLHFLPAKERHPLRAWQRREVQQRRKWQPPLVMGQSETSILVRLQAQKQSDWM
jgi:hypothetical protein